MNAVIAFLANYLLFIMAAGYGLIWLFLEPRSAKFQVGASAAVGLVLTLALITLAGKLHTDPRPFVDNPSLHPLIKHSADNGFPSDHSAAAGLIAALTLWRHRLLGVVMSLAAIVVAAARVAAHVHHLQDVVGGLALGALSAVIAIVLVRAVLARLSQRTGPAPVTESPAPGATSRPGTAEARDR